MSAQSSHGQSLLGRRALVTGSLQGIGLGIATALAAEGAEVILHGLGDDSVIAEAQKAISTITGTTPHAHSSDLRDPLATESLIAEILNSGSVDVLVNNAGIQFTSPLEEMPRSRWDDILAVNLSSAFDTMRLLLPGMRDRGYGRVINISSAHGLVASVHKAPYVAAKHGLVGLTKVAALEYASAGNATSGGVTINAICPGWVETPLIESQIMNRAQALGGDRVAGIADLLSEKQPSRRLSSPEEIGALAVWLCDVRAHNINGASIPIDGAWTAQ
jgi:3-hydroxybutyrate dehydrogenase